MNRREFLIVGSLALPPLAAVCAEEAQGATDPERIDRHALVTRHNIECNTLTTTLPLGNGEFCFTADATGLQTFAGNAMAHWGWHSFPLPAGWTADQVPVTGTFQQGRNTGGDVSNADHDAGAIRSWMFDNPHRMNLGRLRLRHGDGQELAAQEITAIARHLDLWSGAQTSRFTLRGREVQVQTCVHPTLDAVAIRIESALIGSGELEVALDFPYPALGSNAWVGDFARPDDHRTLLDRPKPNRADFERHVDATRYQAALGWSANGVLQDAAPHSHLFRLATHSGNVLELVCAFRVESLPSFEATRRAAAARWGKFWKGGGAIDLSASRDPRWKELERRIVLSQYHTAAQSSGSWPPAETGLLGLDPWRGQFHMEMVWWHLAHFALWNRWDHADRALDCYQRFVPAARALAMQLGYRGLKWPKSVGPEGRSAPWVGNQVLLWKQPHPIFFAELEYRLRPTTRTLNRWRDIVIGTAEHMADYPTRDAATGLYSLAPAMPPSEQGITRDTVFDLAYWRWGLDAAQRWRERCGLAREPHWDEVRQHLAPLPTQDGVFVHSAEWHDTYTRRAWEHPDPVGVFGMLPPIKGVDPDTAHRTVVKVWQTWDWSRTWGWDCPWMAMAAARVGEPQIAIKALLKESPRNQFDVRGINVGGPCPYLPGNGGLLYAIAMMAAGWDGAPDRPAPGFPTDGSWTVRWEGLKKAL
jgi:hypothetical protein